MYIYFVFYGLLSANKSFQSINQSIKKEEITLSIALEMADTHKMYYKTPTSKSQVSEIADKIINFTTKNFSLQ